MAALHIVWATANPILHLFAQQKLQLLKYFDPQKKKKKKKILLYWILTTQNSWSPS